MAVEIPPPTKRLTFRAMVESDLAEVTAYLGAPDTAQPLSGTRTGGDAARWIEWQQRNYAEHGFGLWVVETRDGELVGDCGLTVQEIEGEPFVEVGYHVRPALRGRGLATEAAMAVREAARAGGVEHLVAIIRPANLASQRVATKIGLAFEREVVAHGGPALVFGSAL